MVIRDHSRKVLVSAVNKVQADSPLHAEMLAIELGLKVACAKGCSKIIVETDSLMAVKLMNQGENVLWAEGSLVVDILDFASSCDSCEFAHVCREANTLAHSIAKVEVSADGVYVWEGSIPPNIRL